MEIPNTVLIVDDDREIGLLLAEYIEAHGYRTRLAADGSAMWAALEYERPDVVVLDLNLRGDDGLTLCRKLRVSSNLPVIMLTARGITLDRVLGLEMGADDYLSKPFVPRELLARIRSVLRRHAIPPDIPFAHARQMCFSGWTLDLAARHLLSPKGLVIMLSGAEFRLMRVFLEHPNWVLNRDQLLTLTQRGGTEPFDRAIDIQISRLRQKLGDDARAPQIIKTIRNGGYLLSGHVTTESSARSVTGKGATYY